ncbi:heparin lyase I family protein [Pollutibacter soli]|uniref:heparin lyase I family protein n=1 Tax=Pollutibacter soli TaxID=3034157 RepID=UPI003013A0FD
MKFNLSFIAVFSLFNIACAQFTPDKIVQADYAEQVPSFNWPTPKKQKSGKPPGYMMVTGGANLATFGKTDLGSSITLVSAGEFGAPTPLFGKKCYRMNITKQPGYPSSNDGVRSELYTGEDCKENSGAAWWMVGIFLPTDWCDDNRPIGVAYDFKFPNAQGPPSFYLKIENAQWQATRQYPQGGREYRQYLNPIQKGVWTYWVVHRNFADDDTGFMELYQWVQGTEAEFKQVYEYKGANFSMDCGPKTEGYWLQGLYKWSWMDSTGQGEGTGICNTQYTAYYDNLIVLNSKASIEDFNRFISSSSK